MTEDEFKEVRHRFYKLGLRRRRAVFVSLGLANEGDEEFTKEEERSLLFLLLERENIPELLGLIEKHEADIKVEKDVWRE